MNKFNRSLPEPWMHLLEQRPAWWQGVLDYRSEDANGTQHPLLLAIRHRYLSVYIDGQSVLEVRLDRKEQPPSFKAKAHRKFTQGASGKGYEVLNISEISESPEGIAERLHEWVGRAQIHANGKASRFAASEKQGVAGIVNRNPNVIDVEMALPGLTAPRIDLVALERTGSAINIVFYEAKLFTNPELRARNHEPKVLEQLRMYEGWLTSKNREAEVIDAYRNACVLLVRLRRMQGLPVDDLIEKASEADSRLMVDKKPRLIIFGPQTIGNWPRHEKAIHDAGITGSRLIIEEHPKGVNLSGDTRA